MATELTHLEDQHRYLFSVDGEDVGLTDYRRQGDELHLIHTEIDPAFRGRGLGDAMVQEIFDTVRADGSLKIVAACPFVEDWLERNPGYADVTPGQQ